MLRIIMLCLLETKCIFDESHEDKLEIEEWKQSDNKAMVSQEKPILGTSKNKGIWGSLRRKQKAILPSLISDITDIDSKSIFSYVTLKRPAKNKKNSQNKPLDPNLDKTKEGSQMLDVRKKRSSFYKIFYFGKKDKLGHKNYPETSASENLYSCDYSFGKNETFAPNENGKRFKNKCLENFYQKKSIIKDDKYEIEKYCTLPRNIHKKISSESSNAVNPKSLDIIYESDYSTNKLADTEWKFRQNDDKILEEFIYDIPKHVFFRSKNTKGKDSQKCSCGYNQDLKSSCKIKDSDKIECPEITSNLIKSNCDEPIYDVPKHVFFRLRNNLELCSCIYNHTHRADFTSNNLNKIALTVVTNKPTKNINHKNDQEPIYENLKHLNHFSILPTEKKYDPLHFYQLSIPIQEINNKYKPFNPLTRVEKDDKNLEPLSPLKEEPIYEELDFSKVKLSED